MGKCCWIYIPVGRIFLLFREEKRWGGKWEGMEEKEKKKKEVRDARYESSKQTDP